MKLIEKIIITGEIHAVTGLLIGGANTSMGIGSPDKTVIRNPVTKEPYIPGSSLKGKMRSLLELSSGHLGNSRMGKVEHGPSQDPTHKSTQLFGSARTDESQRPSRIICRDGFLLNPADLKDTDLLYTEAKTEVVIDRITSAAMPRSFERVPAGARFGLNIVLNVFEDHQLSQKELLTLTFKALQLVQDDYLGGSGSRGSGQVKFNISKVIKRTSEYYHGQEPEVDITEIVPSELR